MEIFKGVCAMVFFLVLAGMLILVSALSEKDYTLFIAFLLFVLAFLGIVAELFWRDEI